MVVDCQRAIARSAGLLVLLVAVGAGCGKKIHECDTEDPPAYCNQCPGKLGLIPTDTLQLDESARLNVKDFFKDPDGDNLFYTAESEDPSKVTADMDGAVLTYKGVAPGESEITVTASDGSDEADCSPAKQQFIVTVEHPNRPPRWGPLNPIEVVLLDVAGEQNLAERPGFDDPDGDELTITVDSSDPDVLPVSVEGVIFYYEGLSLGTSTVTLTLTDPEGLYDTKVFEVSVIEEES